MTVGAYILCSIVLLSIVGIQVFTLKEKQMRVKLLISCGTVFTLTIGILALMSVYRDNKEQSTPPMVNNTATIHPISHISELARDLENLRFEPITASDSAEVAHMLAKLEPLDAKTEAEIVQILVDYYPEKKRGELMVGVYTQYYQDLGTIDKPPLTKEQKVLKMVHFAQKNVSALRQIEEEVAEEGQRRRELMRLDPDAYYTAEIQRLEAKIQETEASIRDAEARGDADTAESDRNHLAALQEFIEDTKSDQEWEQGLEARIQEGTHKAIQEWKQNPPEWVKEYQRYMVSAEKLKAEFASLKSGAAAPASFSDVSVSLPPEVTVLPSETTMLPSDSYDHVKSLISAQAALKPWRSVLEEDYFDVLASQALTTEELHQYLPTEDERQILKRRTVQMQKVVVSKMREVVSEIQGATDAEKREFARKLVSDNFDSDFAESVISQLERDDE